MVKYDYLVEFTETQDPTNVHSNFYNAENSSEARKMFMKTVKDLGGKPSDVKILNARRTYEEKWKKRVKAPANE